MNEGERTGAMNRMAASVAAAMKNIDHAMLLDKIGSYINANYEQPDPVAKLSDLVPTHLMERFASEAREEALAILVISHLKNLPRDQAKAAVGHLMQGLAANGYIVMTSSDASDQVNLMPDTPSRSPNGI
jgi:hypothetical protein